MGAISFFTPIMAVSLVLVPLTRADAQAAKIGVYLNDITQINLVSNSFGVDMWLWFRHPNITNYSPTTSTEVASSLGEIGIAHTTTRPVEGSIDVYEIAEFRGTIGHSFDVVKFPFDRHDLLIDVEENILDSTQLVYTVDAEYAMMDPAVEWSPWIFENFRVETTIAKYDTSFGDPRSNSIDYARLNIIVTISRSSPAWLMIKCMSGSIAGFILITSALLVNYESLGDRLFLDTAAVFCVIGNQLILDSMIPPSKDMPVVYQIQAFVFCWLIALNFYMILASRDVWEKMFHWIKLKIAKKGV